MSQAIEIERSADGILVERPKGELRQRAVRVDFALRVKIFTPAMIEARAMNISGSGLLVKTNTALTIGQEVELDFYLDLWHHNLGARVARIRGDQVALEFLNLEKDARFAIITYIATHRATKRAEAEVARQRDLAAPLAAKPVAAAAVDPSATMVLERSAVVVGVASELIGEITSAAKAKTTAEIDTTAEIETAEAVSDAGAPIVAETPALTREEAASTAELQVFDDPTPSGETPVQELEPGRGREIETQSPSPAAEVAEDAIVDAVIVDAAMVHDANAENDDLPPPDGDFTEVLEETEAADLVTILGEAPVATRSSRRGLVLFVGFVAAVAVAIYFGALDYLPPTWSQSLRASYAKVRAAVAPDAAVAVVVPSAVPAPRNVAVPAAVAPRPVAPRPVAPQPIAPQPIAPHAREIDRLVGEGEAFLAAGTWSLPKDACALDRYRAVLELESGNTRAIAGMVAVVDGYARRAGEVAAAGDARGARWRYERAIELLSELEARVPDGGGRAEKLRRAMAALPNR